MLGIDPFRKKSHHPGKQTGYHLSPFEKMEKKRKKRKHGSIKKTKKTWRCTHTPCNKTFVGYFGFHKI